MAAAERDASSARADGWARSAAAFLPKPLATTSGLAAVVLLYRLAYSIPAALASPALGMDNVADNVWDQNLRLVYQLRQPPLYEWLLWPVQRLVGPTPASFLILKAGIVTATAVFLFGAARHAVGDRRMAALSVLTYALFYNVSWTMLERLTQSSLLLCCCAATAFAFARVLSRGRALDHALLGLALGAGLLAKFNFALFAVSLFAAALTEPWSRRRLGPRLTISLLTAAIVIAPFVYGLVVGGDPLASAMANVMEEGARAPYPARVGQGLVNLAVALLEFGLPLVALAPAFFWRQLSAKAPAGDDPQAAMARLYGRVGPIAAALAAAGVVLTGSLYIRDWHVLPMFVTAPIWLFARLERVGVGIARLRLWTWTIVAAAAGCALVSLVGLFAPDPAFCGRCRSLEPYPALASDLRRLGGANATLLVLDRYTAGNLRIWLPSARIAMPGYTPSTPPRKLCLAVWDAGAQRRPLALALPAFYPRADLDDAGGGGFFSYRWPPFRLSSAPRASTWGVRRLSPAAPNCR